MVQDKTFGAVELDTKQFSGEMVIVLVIHVAILVYDRVLYINQNRKNLQFEYIFYDKVDGKPLPENIVLKEEIKIQKDTVWTHMKTNSILYYQELKTEEKNNSIIV